MGNAIFRGLTAPKPFDEFSKNFAQLITSTTPPHMQMLTSERTLKITISAVSSVASVILITGTLIYKLRLKVFRRWKLHPFDRDECVGEDMDYDVFLCCSSRDDDLHGNYIQELIEANGYRVCYHERDFLPGQVIEDNIVRAIERSKRTVCLVSNNFLQR